jgi:outer membrane protein assembly factor BamD (BamD/ComL family)
MKNALWIVLSLTALLSSCSSVQKSNRVPKEQIAHDLRDARALYEMGETQAAIAQLSQALEKRTHGREHDQAYELLIEWLLETNNYAEAKRYATHFFNNYPTSPSAKRIDALFKSRAIHEKQMPQSQVPPVLKDENPSGESPTDIEIKIENEKKKPKVP